MKNLRIEYNPNRCVGTQKCIHLAPEYFSFEGEKAVLKGAVSNKGQGIRDKEAVGGGTLGESGHGAESGVQHLQISVTPAQQEKFVEAAKQCPVNAIKVIDEDEQKVLVDTEVSVAQDVVQTVPATYDDLKEFMMDPLGYFLIRVNTEKKLIEVALCRELNKVEVIVTGKKPLEIYQTIIKHGLVSRLDHAAYLGRELQKAYIALIHGLKYVQDDELDLEEGQ